MSSNNRKGLRIINTGNGKEKSTAAFGTLLRAWGCGFRICVVQFIKSETGKWGEIKAAENLGIEWHASGDGYISRSKNLDETIARARHGRKLAQEKIVSANYDLIVLDEFIYPLKYGWLDTTTVIDWLKANRPSELHLIMVPP